MAIINPMADAAAAAQAGAAAMQPGQSNDSGEDAPGAASGNTRDGGVDLSLSAAASASLAEARNVAVTPGEQGAGADTSNNRETANPALTGREDDGREPFFEDVDLSAGAPGAREAQEQAQIDARAEREERGRDDVGQAGFTTNNDGSGDASAFDGVQVDVSA
ncbi:hypothetical protein CCR85_14555 [Rhodothalassium salexigens]|uniref:hypothetical protein n=1 Tax=Rhodothalassium salexigens TaxID=1086 RepID=UPI001913B71B|nr:hypothetical protein [Rhodothalassium salexigens]MBK5912701.1 hypothetical protein [Rhodothalassium salexigens]